MIRTLLTSVAYGTLVLCGGASAADLKIGLVRIDLSNPFHIGEVEGAKEAARRYHFDLHVTSGEGDVTKQIQAFENLINQHVNAIAVNFIDVGAFGPAMKEAQAAHIPVVCLHSSTDGCAKMLGFDERATGRMVGEYAKLELIYGNSDSLTVPADTVLKRAERTDIQLVSVDGSNSGLAAVKSGVLKSTVFLSPQYSGFWKAYMPFLVASAKAPVGDFRIKGAMVLPQNVSCVQGLAAGMSQDAAKFPFEKPLPEIVAACVQ